MVSLESGLSLKDLKSDVVLLKNVFRVIDKVRTARCPFQMVSLQRALAEFCRALAARKLLNKKNKKTAGNTIKSVHSYYSEGRLNIIRWVTIGINIRKRDFKCKLKSFCI